MPVVIRFNGKDLPSEMEKLSPGEYLVETLADAPTLSAEDEEGLRIALASLREGKSVGADEARRRIKALLS